MPSFIRNIHWRAAVGHCHRLRSVLNDLYQQICILKNYLLLGLWDRVTQLFAQAKYQLGFHKGDCFLSTNFIVLVCHLSIHFVFVFLLPQYNKSTQYSCWYLVNEGEVKEMSSLALLQFFICNYYQLLTLVHFWVSYACLLPRQLTSQLRDGLLEKNCITLDIVQR